MFYVLDEDGKPFAEDERRVRQVVETLTRAFDADRKIPEVQRRTSRLLKQFTLKTRTFMHNDASGNLTALEVITPDRPGLLAHLGRIFVRYGIRLYRARIATLGERVEDVFYITDKNDEPLSDPEFCRQLQETICRELDERNRSEATSAPMKETMPWQ